MKKLNILIVDDNQTNRIVLCEQLTRWGASVIEAEDGAKALSLCQQRMNAGTPEKANKAFNIALIDMQMPEMDGAELGKRLRKNKYFDSMKMVMMTSINNRGDAKFFADLGYNAYFPKPTTTTDLFYALSIVATGGNIESQAEPLVTSHYIKSLKQNEIDNDQTITWPDNTRILLVEDNRVNQLVAKGMLKKLGLKADLAENGKEALDSIKLATTVQPDKSIQQDKKPYTLILMDCQMPEMNGYDASHQIRQGKAGNENKDIPIIAMTANAMQGDKEKCFEAGMSDYMAKPVTPKKIKTLLIKWLIESSDK